MQRPRPVIGDGPLHIIQRNAVEVSLLNFHSQHAFALVMRGRTLEIAGTTGIAVATLEVSSGHAPLSHVYYPPSRSACEAVLYTLAQNFKANSLRLWVLAAKLIERLFV